MTSPSSWRMTAWLIVATASVVLIVLVHGAVRLAGPTGRSGQVDAFPGLPTGGLLTPQPPRTNTPTVPFPPSQDADERWSTPPTTQPGSGIPTSLATPADDQPGDQPPAPNEDAQTGAPPAGGATTPPQDEDQDVDNVGDATSRFFDLLPEDTGAAWLMMNPQDRRLDFAEFNQEWRRYKDVEILGAIIADPTTVFASVMVTEHKGPSATQHWKLVYQPGVPVIDELVLLDPDASVTGLSVNPP